MMRQLRQRPPKSRAAVAPQPPAWPLAGPAVGSTATVKRLLRNARAQTSSQAGQRRHGLLVRTRLLGQPPEAIGDHAEMDLEMRREDLRDRRWARRRQQLRFLLPAGTTTLISALVWLAIEIVAK